MKLVVSALISALVLSPSAALAQVDAPVAVPTQQYSVLRSGTSVPLRTLEGLTTEGKKLKVGHRFRLETSEPVTLNGVVVIPVGSPAMAEVTGVRNKGMWGKSGRIEVRLLHVRAGDRQIRLSGAMDDKGVTGTAGVVGAIAVLPVAGFFMTGTSARIPAGSIVTGFTEEDVPVAVAPAAIQPLVVETPAAPVTTAAPAAPAAVDAPAADVVGQQN